MDRTRMAREVGERIAEVRGERSQREWSKETGIPQQSISYWEQGRGVPSAETLVRIARHEGVSLNWLFLGTGRKRM